VVSQYASLVYTSIYQPEHCSGISGQNSAIRREVLEQAGSFYAGAPSGGDYYLSKQLLQLGTRIRYEVDAPARAEFHTELRPYLRQQARWLRNVVIHGIHFRAYREVASCLCTSLIGSAMLAMPCFAFVLACFLGASSIFVQVSAAVWAFAFWHAWLSRLRYLRVTTAWTGIRIPRRVAALIPLFLLIDFVAWTIPLGQYPCGGLRQHW
jgi:cellulose synthase/poly-beta-1,6-N-acetylglucosamine synthase-like glycosyltransferase